MLAPPIIALVTAAVVFTLFAAYDVWLGVALVASLALVGVGLPLAGAITRARALRPAGPRRPQRRAGGRGQGAADLIAYGQQARQAEQVAALNAELSAATATWRVAAYTALSTFLNRAGRRDDPRWRSRRCAPGTSTA